MKVGMVELAPATAGNGAEEDSAEEDSIGHVPRSPGSYRKGGQVDLSMIARVLWLRRRLRRHRALEPQRAGPSSKCRSGVLRRFAMSESPFYRTFHQGLDRAPLAALPPLSKADLMDNFDQISTQPTVRLADVNTYLDDLTDNRPFRNRYWVSATSGSSGRRSVIASSAHEWAMIIASASAGLESFTSSSPSP